VCAGAAAECDAHVSSAANCADCWEGSHGSAERAAVDLGAGAADESGARALNVQLLAESSRGQSMLKNRPL
jgi:hypothetical protein